MRIFISGTMRSGNSLVSNILSIHEDILILKIQYIFLDFFIIIIIHLVMKKIIRNSYIILICI